MNDIQKQIIVTFYFYFKIWLLNKTLKYIPTFSGKKHGQKQEKNAKNNNKKMMNFVK